jgi:hypothetical protein
MQIAIRAFAAIVAAALSGSVFGQAVSIKDGKVLFKAKDGSTIQITSSGLDSDPSLSVNGKLVVFVRRTPTSKIDTGAGSLDTNELWVAETTAAGNAHRILSGHSAGAKSGDPLAGFTSPKFSLDARRVYFLAQLAATSQHLFVLDLKSEQVRFLCRGIGFEVLNSGNNAGFLIVLKDIPRVMPGHVARYWLLDQDGKDVGEIGENESDVRSFKNGKL